MKLFLKILFKNAWYFFRVKNQRTFHWLVFRYSGTPRFQKRKVSFMGYTIMVADALSFVWQFKEIFADGIYSFNTTRNNPLIYDCGSNIGMSILFFKQLYPNATIKAFEADPEIAGLLQQNLNGNNISGVSVTGKAVWIHNNGVEIVSDGADGASILSTGNRKTIASVRLKELLDREAEIDFLKMDIEGAETEVIRDCKESLGKIKNLFIEYHSYTGSGQHFHEILSILNQSGFRYYTLPVNIRRRPFIEKGLDKTMDYQVNLFAYRI